MIQGARADRVATEIAPDIFGEPEPAEIAAFDEPDARPAPRRGPRGIAIVIIAVAAIAWLAALGGALLPATGLSALRLLAWIGLGSGPLALLGVIALLLRSGGPRTRATLAAAARLRDETGELVGVMARLDDQVANARAELERHAAVLTDLGADAGERLTRAAAELGGQAETVRHAAVTLDDATATARTDLGAILTDLPRAEAAIRLLSDRLRQDGADAETRAQALSPLLVALHERARAAAQASATAATRLEAQLDRIDTDSNAARQRIGDTATAMRAAVDEALDTAATGVEETRRAVAGQSAALTAMIDQGRASLDSAGDDATRRLGDRLDALVARVEGLGGGLARQDEVARQLLAGLDQAAAALETRLATLGQHGADHAGEVAATLDAVQARAEAVSRHLAAQDRAATSVLDRVSQLRAQAEAGSTTLGETIPAALARVRLHAEQSLQAIALAGERGERLHDTAEAVGARLAEADTVLERQQHFLDGASGEADQRLALINDKAAGLRTLVARIDEDMRALNQGAAAELVEALFRVREAATEAGERASDAIAAAIPRAAQRLGESASRALVTALADVGQAEIDAVGAASAQAVEAARTASERLSRQLLTIAETATAIDARIAANREDTEAHDEASFARGAGLLIESLNSAAIDLTRLFATDVSEEAWKAYLRGDRGIFTRRAVRLLDRTEAATIVQRYENEAEFHEQVDRYIHDFEALLRRVMMTLDGAGMATTLLSSDLGKLYVALAQAIERLRR